MKMQESNNPTGETSRETNIESQRGRNFTIPQPIAEEEQQQPLPESAVEEIYNKESSATIFIDSVKKFFAPCVGAVDAASFYIGECRPSNLDSCDPNEHGENVAEDVIMRLRERNGGFNQQTLKRRSETLEIPAHGMLFDDDDVSAISSHTLEEMERLRMAQSSRLANFQMSPSINYSSIEAATRNIMRFKPSDSSAENKQTWNIQKSQGTNERTDSTNDLSICVSASDSTGSEGMEHRKGDKALEQSAPSWGRKADKNKEFKTHPVG